MAPKASSSKMGRNGAEVARKAKELAQKRAEYEAAAAEAAMEHMMEEVECEIAQEEADQLQEWSDELSSSESIATCRSDGWVPSHVEKAIPLPDGLKSFLQWSDTVCRLPKYKGDQLSFRELVIRGSRDRDVLRYLKWIESKYLTEDAKATTKVEGRLRLKNPVANQATDLALYLGASKAVQALEEYIGAGGGAGGYHRTFKTMQVNLD